MACLMCKCKIAVLIIVSSLVTALLFAHSVTAAEPLKFQVHPYLSSSELLKRFSLLTKYIKEKTGYEVVCNISKDYDEHIVLVGNNKADIAYMGPASYIRLVNKYGEMPILARLEIKGSPLFQGVIVTRTASPIKSLQELRGRRFAFGDPNSTMSYLVPLYMMHESGVPLKSLAGYSFLNTHKNVALGVLMGEFDAGAVKEEVYHQYKYRGLKAIAWSPKISEHLFVVSKNLSEDVVVKLKEALLSLNDYSGAKDIMESIKINMTALVPASDKDYDNLRKILAEVERINKVR